MKLIELIPFLLEPIKLEELCKELNLNQNSEAILIYMENALEMESDIIFFEIEETEDEQVFFKKEKKYIQLFPLDYSSEAINNYLGMDLENYTELEIAERLLIYRINGA